MELEEKEITIGEIKITLVEPTHIQEAKLKAAYNELGEAFELEDSDKGKILKIAEGTVNLLGLLTIKEDYDCDVLAKKIGPVESLRLVREALDIGRISEEEEKK